MKERTNTSSSRTAKSSGLSRTKSHNDRQQNLGLLSPFATLKNSSGKHKDWYSIEFIRLFCQVINPKDEIFKTEKFVREFGRRFSKLELKERLNLIVELLDKYLTGSYAQKLDTLRPLLGGRWPHEKGMFTHGFFLYPVSQFVEVHGIENLSLSLKFIEDLTMRFTGEWAIRPLAIHEPVIVLAQMKQWAGHENFHVRRLASEGLRARLPWGMKISWIDAQPESSWPIYNRLRNDKVLYVRRSVGNAMGDMIKISQNTAYDVLTGWFGKRLSLENCG